MRIEKTDTFAGLPAIKIRALLRRIDESLSVDFAMRSLNVSETQAQNLIKELLHEGFLEIENGRNMLTVKGAALRQANAAKPIRRTTALKRIEEFIERIHIVNNSEDYLWSVSRAVLFGTVLSDSPSVNDVDIAYSLTRKVAYKNFEQYNNARKARIALAEKNGKTFRSLQEEICWPQVEVLQFLKNRTRTISLLDYDLNKSVIESGRHQILFELPPT